MPPINLTPYELHKKKWAGGCGSDYCDRARKLVFARGTIPADLLFIGEAPGESEDGAGRPFVGPAGKLLDYMIYQAIPHCRVKDHDTGIDQMVPEIPYAMTNLVCCIPKEVDPDTGRRGKVSEPCPDQIGCCKERLSEFIDICQPKLIVAVGAVARDYMHQGYKHSVKLPKHIHVVDIIHPGSLLKSGVNIAQRGYVIQNCVVVICNAIEDHILGG